MFKLRGNYSNVKTDEDYASGIKAYYKERARQDRRDLFGGMMILTGFCGIVFLVANLIS